MHSISFLEQIAADLNMLGIGVYPGTSATRTIYIGSMPDSPDALIGLYARPGRPPDLHADIHYPELHVEVRAATYQAAQIKAEAIGSALHGRHDEDFSGTRYLLIQALGDPCKLLVDDRNRTVFYQNFRVTKSA